MANTTQKVELGFGPGSSWVDVTSYAGNISINRGTTRVADDYQAGQLSITFTNNDRTFDPLNTSSILYNSGSGYTMVQPGGRVRITTNSIVRFYGYVQDWSFTYDNAGFDGNATLTAGDLMYYMSRINFTGGTQSTGDFSGERISNILYNNNLVTTGTSGRANKSILGSDVQAAGDNVLSYLQNVARSEPGDLFASASSSATMIFKDRTFTDYTWRISSRQNVIPYPATATVGTSLAIAGITNGWTNYIKGTATPYIYGHITSRASASVANIDTEISYAEVNSAKYNPLLSNPNYVVSFWAKGSGVTGSGITLYATLLNSLGQSIGSPASTTIINASGITQWTQISGTATTGTATVAGISILVTSAGTTSPYGFETDAWQVETTSTYDSTYFDGSYRPLVSNYAVKREVAWLGTPYQSSSVMGINTASSTPTPSTYLTFADNNSQGTAFGNGTAIPFTDISLANSGLNLYNQVLIGGVNATATVTDTAGTGLYGLRSYSQTDNLTTSLTRPTEVAADLLGYWRLPEYRADSFVVALEALTLAQQNLVLGLELRDVIRLCFQPSAIGAIVDKYYQILAINSEVGIETDHITFTVASLTNVPMRLDSTLTNKLNTSILG